jgi:hypothetical protein
MNTMPVSNLGAALHRAMHLIGEVSRGLFGAEGPELRALILRITDDEIAHPGHELAGELVGHGLDHDESLGRHAALPGVVHAADIGPARGLLDVRVLEDDERVAAAELEDCLLEVLPRGGGEARAGVFAPGERGSFDARIVEQLRDLAPRDQEVGVDARRRVGLAKDGLDGDGALRDVVCSGESSGKLLTVLFVKGLTVAMAMDCSFIPAVVSEESIVDRQVVDGAFARERSATSMPGSRAHHRSGFWKHRRDPTTKPAFDAIAALCAERAPKAAARSTPHLVVNATVTSVTRPDRRQPDHPEGVLVKPSSAPAAPRTARPGHAARKAPSRRGARRCV